MKFAINAPNFGTYADPAFVTALARSAEAAGWDGFFLWDHIRPGPVPLGDPWLLLTAIALSSERLALGPMVTPLPRRKPEEVARQATTLDHISGGRLVLGVGLGDDGWREFSAFGPYPEDRTRAEMLDEGLDVITALWRGDVVTRAGKHYAVTEALFAPAPVQRPRVPIWVAGRWPSRRPFDRAARWDGA